MEPPFLSASEAEVERACQLGWQAFEEYRQYSGKRKAAFLRGIADALDGLGEPLIERVNAETGLPEARVKAELGRTTGQLRLFADLVEEGSWARPRIDRGDPQRTPVPKPDVRSISMPIGPVAVFAPSNFPLAFSVAGGDTASALAAGCPVIVKAHHSHPGTSEMAARAVLEAARRQGLPEGIFSLVFGPGRTVGQALVAHPAVKAVGFTGSRAGGKALMETAARRPEPIPVYAEMSSINPVFLLPGAFENGPDDLAQGLCGSVNLGVGQFCTNPGLVLFRKGETASRWADQFKGEMANAPAGTMLNEGIRDSYMQGLEKRKSNPNARLLAAGQDDGESKGFAGLPAVFETTAKHFLEDPSLGDELFGPETTLVAGEDEGELVRIAESLEGQLTASVFGTEKDFEQHAGLIRNLEQKVGRVIFNGFPTGVEVCHAMVHGGPYPSTSDGRSTSVGTLAIDRFTRHVAYQNAPDSVLPDELKDGNPVGMLRLVDGAHTRD